MNLNISEVSVVESDLTWNAGLLMEEPSGSDDEEAYVLVAALAAALVAYQGSDASRNGNGHRPRSHMNWRMMARWGQLRGYL